MENEFNPRECRTRRRPVKNHYAFALTLIIAGLIFLAVNTGIIPTVYKFMFSVWPFWVIVFGLFCLFRKNFYSATVLISVGIFFIIPYFSQIHPEWCIPANFTSTYWPVLLIIAGILIIIDKLCPRHFPFFCNFDNARTTSFDNEDGYIHVSSSFDSRKNIVLDPIFRGADIKCSFGEVIIDLRKTNLQEGTTKIYVNVSFGSIGVIVPDTWNVQLKGDSVFGTFNDNRITKNFYPEEPRKLIIEGKCSFGEFFLKD